MINYRPMSNSEADKWLFVALFAWLVSCIHPALGMLLQFPMIIYLVCKCDIKSLPALMVLMLGKGNINFFGRSLMALRLGITLTPSSCFTIVAFLLAVYNLIQQRYDRRSSAFGWFWLCSIIPASIMSFTAKADGLVGTWSSPIMDFIIPGVYFWAISCWRSYEFGKEYCLERLGIVCAIWNVLTLLGITFVFTFFQATLPICIFIWAIRSKRCGKSLKFILLVGFVAAVCYALFGRRMAMEAAMMDVTDADKIGSTFSRIAVLLCAILIVMLIRRAIVKPFIRMIPIVMILFNFLLVAFVIQTQAGNQARNVSQQFEDIEGRFEYKLFGDRAAVWTQGWEEVKAQPYFIKDLRDFYEVRLDGTRGERLLPHNQYLTLIGRKGWWLGLVLSLFIILVWTRAFDVGAKMLKDDVVAFVILPVGSAVFFIVGMTGQSVVSSDLWGNALVAIVFPGVIYGHMINRIKLIGFFR